jgi:EpsI family protein
MANITKLRIVVIIGLLCITTGISQVIMHRQSVEYQQPGKHISLQQFFIDLPGFPGRDFIPLTSEIVQELKLDDYLYRSFGTPDLPISLYIGFYRTARKVGASHDPLVCYPGQGWQVFNRGNGIYKIAGNSNQIINYATMLAQRENNQELLIYWFQTHDKTSSNTIKQKIDMIGQRLMGGGENNAFIRISSPVTDANVRDVVQQRMFEFIDAFYPLFLSYLSRN